MKVEEIEIAHINQFSQRDRDYYLKPESFRDFVAHDFDIASFENIISLKSKQKIDRNLLYNVLTNQYASTTSSDITRQYIDDLQHDNCYTITTAHQPSLLSGPLYYVFKILSAIKVCKTLRLRHADLSFVPVFVIGAEDHDFEEINHLHLYNKKIEWTNEGSGPVGQFTTEGLETVLNEVSEILGPQSKSKEILDTLTSEMSSFTNYSDFSFRLTHLLFDHIGLVILRMGNHDLKNAFVPFIKEEIFNQASQPLVTKTQDQIKATLGYDNQAYVREINFFYTDGQNRDRIEYDGSHYTINNRDTTFSKASLTKEIESYPERFSPNVVMRPLFQEAILPNLAYIGGGGELAYWMERKSQFKHFALPFPMLIRRTSGLILTPNHVQQIEKLGLSLTQIFNKESNLVNTLLELSDQPDYSLSNYREEIDNLFNKISKDLASIDPNLARTAGAEAAKALKSIDYLESKAKKAIKSKEEINLNRLSKLKSSLFPQGLQERHDNILQYISTYGIELLEHLMPHCDPFDKCFKVFMPQPD